MKKTILFAALIIAATGFTTQVSAQYADRHSDEQQYDHHKRIRNGMRNGELTRSEARHLRMREARFRHDKHMAMRDGRLTPRERRHLRKEEKRNGMAIYRNKHNNNYRY
jgi:hypothetical protein